MTRRSDASPTVLELPPPSKDSGAGADRGRTGTSFSPAQASVLAIVLSASATLPSSASFGCSPSFHLHLAPSLEAHVSIKYPTPASSSLTPGTRPRCSGQPERDVRIDTGDGK